MAIKLQDVTATTATAKQNLSEAKKPGNNFMTDLLHLLPCFYGSSGGFGDVGYS